MLGILVFLLLQGTTTSQLLSLNLVSLKVPIFLFLFLFGFLSLGFMEWDLMLVG